MATIIKLPQLNADIGECLEPANSQVSLVFPLSAAQERVWRADRDNPGDSAYNVAFRWSLKGPLDISIVERAFNEIVARHEILRASFTVIGVDPVQLIAPSAKIDLKFHDVRSLEDCDQQVDDLCRTEATRGFEIEAGPLLRVTVIRVEEQHYLLLLTAHLLVADGWSIRVMMDELRQLYRAFSEGQASPLPELVVQYPDYVIWQRERAEDAEREAQLAYWKSSLKNYRRLEVPGDREPPAQPGRDSDIVSRELRRELTDTLNQQSNRRGGTMFVTVLSALCVLLKRYTGRDDIAVGSELAGRNRTELEALVGLFINHVVIRTDVAGDPRFIDLADRVRDAMLEIFANQDVPFEDVIKARAADRDIDPEPFFVVNFNCYRAYGGSSNSVIEPAKIQVTPIPSISQGALYRLNFFMVERESGWRLSIDFNKHYYSREFAQGLLDDFCGLLEQISSGPELRASEFVVSGPQAAQGSPVSETQEPMPSNDAAEEFCTMPASVAQERFWLLARLDPNSAKFHMRATVRLTGSVSTNVLQASFQHLVDRHEILRTTFAEYEGELVQVISARQAFALSVADLTQIADAERESRLQELLQEEARQPFDLERGPLFRACLFVLGTAEAVLLITTHHIIVDGWSQRVIQDELWANYEALAGNRPAHLAPLSIQYADFASWQQDWLKSPEASAHLDHWLTRLKDPLDVVDFPTDRPPAARMTAKGGIESLSLPAELIQDLKRVAKAEGVTMFALSLACFAILLSRYSEQPEMVIGSPVANRSPETEPLIGPFAGPIPFRVDLGSNPTIEEAIAHVSQVYLDALDHADLPFEALLKQLRIRSVDGRTVFFQFYFLYQVAFLQPHQVPGLTVSPMPTFSVGTPFELQLALIERQDELRVNCEYNADLFDPGSIRLILDYYQMLLRTVVSNRRHRITELPAPTVPKRARESIPLAEESTARVFVAPSTEDEIKLAEIWKAILKVPVIGMNDNFFELGGHSLLAAELVTRVQASFGITIDLSLLMVAPTAGQLARKLHEALQTDRPHIVAIRETGNRLPLFCIHGGGGHLLDYRDLIAALPGDVPVYGLRASDAKESCPDSVEDLASQYVREIQAVQPNGPYQICGLSFGGLVAFEIATKFVEMGEAVALIALFDTGNWAHYRNLPAEQLAKFRRKYLNDRLRKYGRNLIHGRFDELWADARLFVTSRLDALLWKVGQDVCRSLGVPVPRFLRSNLVLFSAIGRKYVPRSYPGRLLLFRAEGRTAEYGDDLTLGWSNIAAGGIVVHQVPGNHLSIMRQPQVARLIEQLSPYLASAPERQE
ncbi:condensation domain-containing protein [Bradyrhizobium sp. HKCCYLS1011]|uniref:condensation domain-containing protein n=1 Tax=Bradyrhizobium sp. HKCCYLS1011 TaxID=3420733 RepID=UPI003EBAC4F4